MLLPALRPIQAGPRCQHYLGRGELRVNVQEKLREGSVAHIFDVFRKCAEVEGLYGAKTRSRILLQLLDNRDDIVRQLMLFGVLVGRSSRILEMVSFQSELFQSDHHTVCARGAHARTNHHVSTACRHRATIFPRPVLAGNVGRCELCRVLVCTSFGLSHCCLGHLEDVEPGVALVLKKCLVLSVTSLAVCTAGCRQTHSHGAQQ
mmetsp:Transcript_45961/g.107459  ORF Transcript_45961/g.107459 Transcript_45961/m.107459 type:complete len:205 (-) Transcript_45961:103-717(-)